MNKFTKAVKLLQEDRDALQGVVHVLENKIKVMERELKTPREHSARIADQGRIIQQHAEEIRQLKAQVKRQAAALRTVREALR